jgi:hypothetical protein
LHPHRLGQRVAAALVFELLFEPEVNIGVICVIVYAIRNG